MSSKRERVLGAIKALVVAALPYADVVRNADQPDEIAPGGSVIVRDGDPGEPEVDLSPATFNYQHRIALEVAAYQSGSRSREQVLDDMLGAIGDAVRADRTLGGLCDYLEAEAPSTDDLRALGAEPARWADAVIVASYATSDPFN
ncbi:MAG: hypothetical protein IIZ63_10070 [Caulobacteraceae bacterium]|nr:hypothetical protein [Caulobacteraceae bacterium]